MAKNKSLKRALITSALSLTLSCSMLVGTTFAWFTDSVTSENNIIQTGKLDVSLEYANEAPTDVNDAKWTNASSGQIFKYNNWEPGYTDVKYVKIENEGTLDLKFVLNIVPNKEAEGVNLADVIEVYMIDGAKNVERSALTTSSDAYVGTLTSLMNEKDGAAHGVLYADDEDKPEDGNVYEIYTIALKMSTSAGNEYMEKSVGGGFSVQLLATQLASEADSIDKDYDKDADYDGEISNATSLAAAFTNGGTYKLINDITLDSAATVAKGATVTLDLNGKTLSSEIDKTTGAVINNNGTMTITGGTVKNDKVNGGATINNNGTMVLDDVAIVGAPIGAEGEDYPEYAVTTAGKLTVEDGTSITADFGAIAMKDGADVIINGGDIEVTDALGDRVKTTHVIDAKGYNSHLTIYDGNFALDYASGAGVSVISPRGATIKVYGGNFSYAGEKGGQSGIFQNYMGYGDYIDVYGGTYNDTTVNGVEYQRHFPIADGYTAVDNGDGTYTVKSSAAVLSEALAQGGDVALTSNTTLSENITTNKDISVDLNQKTLSIDKIEIQANATFSNGTVRFDTTFGKFDIRPANGDVTITFTNVTFDNVRSHANTVGSGVGNLTDNTITTYTGGNGAEIKLVFENCTFNNARASFNRNDKVDVMFKNCQFNCTVTNNAIIDFNVDVQDSKLAVKGCTFTVTSNYENCTVINGNYNPSFDIQENTATMISQSGSNYYFLGGTNRGTSQNPNVIYENNTCTGFRNSNGR